MYLRRSQRGGAILAFVLAQVTATSIYALAADGPGWAKEGSAPISGLKVEDVKYDLGDENPHLIERVSFRVAGIPSGSEVSVRLSPTGDWFECASVGQMATCATPRTTAESATQLSVVLTG